MSKRGGVLSKDKLGYGVQTAVSVTVVGLLTWAGSSLNELQKNSATSGVEISYIKSEVDLIKQNVRSMRVNNDLAYTRKEANEYHADVKSEFKDIRLRVRNLETGRSL